MESTTGADPAAILLNSGELSGAALWIAQLIEGKRGGVLLHDWHEEKWLHGKGLPEYRRRRLNPACRLWPTILESYTPTDRCTAIFQGDELIGFHREGHGLGSIRERRKATRDVAEWTPIEVFAQAIANTGTMRAMTGRPYSHPPARVQLVFDVGLVWLPAQAFFGIDEVLPDDGRRNRHLKAHIDISVLRANIFAPGLTHRLNDGLEVVHTATCLAERLVRLAVLWQVEGRRQALQTGLREEGVRLRAVAVANRVLQQAMDKNDVRPGEVFPAVVTLDHEGPEMRDELEAERRDRLAGVAAARRPRVMSSNRLEKSK